MLIRTLLQGKGDHVATVQPDASVAEVVQGLARHGVGALVVSADGTHIDGIVSERDVVRALHDAGPSVLTQDVRSIMTAEVEICSPDDRVDSLMPVMTEHRIRHVPVVGPDGRLAGIVSIGDVVKQRLGELESENAVLHDYLHSGR